MANIKLEKLKEITDIRKIWKNEATDFTPWLYEEDNMQLLSEAIGISIISDERESPVGDFNVDIFAKDPDTGNKIIIENQLSETNHDHLGKLITYASGKQANVVIWVVKHAREEHKSAIEWLNNHTDDTVSFYLCEIKVYQIGNSEKAVKFEVVEKPNEWSRELKAADKLTDTKLRRHKFWSAFQEYTKSKSEFNKCLKFRKIGYDHWIDFSIGSSDCHLSVCQVAKHDKLTVELNINDNKELYKKLFSRKDFIEKETDLVFDWMELPEKKTSRIVVAKTNVDLTNENKWNNLFDWLIEVLIKMKIAFSKEIQD